MNLDSIAYRQIGTASGGGLLSSLTGGLTGGSAAQDASSVDPNTGMPVASTAGPKGDGSVGLFDGVLKKALIFGGLGAAAGFLPFIPGGPILGGIMGALGGVAMGVFGNWRKQQAIKQQNAAYLAALGVNTTDPSQQSALLAGQVPTQSTDPSQLATDPSQLATQTPTDPKNSTLQQFMSPAGSMSLQDVSQTGQTSDATVQMPQDIKLQDANQAATSQAPPDTSQAPPVSNGGVVQQTPSKIDDAPPKVDTAPPKVSTSSGGAAPPDQAPPKVDIAPPTTDQAPPKVDACPPKVDTAPPKVDTPPTDQAPPDQAPPKIDNGGITDSTPSKVQLSATQNALDDVQQAQTTWATATDAQKADIIAQLTADRDELQAILDKLEAAQSQTTTTTVQQDTAPPKVPTDITPPKAPTDITPPKIDATPAKVA